MSKRSNHAGVYSISLCALLLSMMLIVGYVESMIPLNVGIPGIKLGMSNSVLIFAVYMLDIPTAFMLMSLKVLLSGILFAGPTTMMYGFAGGVLSLLCMALLSRIKGLSIPVVSIVGGVMHNVGQIGMSLLVLQVPPMSMLGYLGVLMCVGAVCGLLTGVCAKSVMAHLKHLSWPGAAKRGQSKPGVWIAALVLLTAIGLVCWKAAAPAATEPTDVTIVSDVPALEGLPTLPRGNGYTRLPEYNNEGYVIKRPRILHFLCTTTKNGADVFCGVPPLWQLEIVCILPDLKIERSGVLLQSLPILRAKVCVRLPQMRLQRLRCVNPSPLIRGEHIGKPQLQQHFRKMQDFFVILKPEGCVDAV